MAVFDEHQLDPNPLETLVGEGKKFKTTEELAAAKIEADRTIEARNREMAELRTELDKRLTAEELIAQIRQREPVAPKADGENQPAAPKEVTDDDLVRRIREVKQQDDLESTRLRNLEQVTNHLVSVFGDEDKAAQALKVRAAELGVSVQFLRDSAAQSPRAFFATLGLKDAEPTPAAAPGDVNPRALAAVSQGNAAAGTYRHYDEMRKTDPRRYFSTQVQNQMHADALKKGADFYV